jgi:hypothetical protein
VESTIQEHRRPPKRLSHLALARALGVNSLTLYNWRAKGCPTDSLEAAIAWKANYQPPKRRPESQARPGNKNGALKLEKQAARMGLVSPKTSKPKLSPEIVKQVAEYILNGFNDDEIATLCDVNVKTIYNWRRLDPIKKAMLLRKDFLIAKIRDGTRPDWTRVAWWMERRWPEQYSRPEVAAQIKQTNNSMTVNQTLMISADVAKELTARSAEAAKRVKELFANRVTPAADRPAKLPDRDYQSPNDLE